MTKITEDSKQNNFYRSIAKNIRTRDANCAFKTKESTMIFSKLNYSLVLNGSNGAIYDANGGSIDFFQELTKDGFLTYQNVFSRIDKSCALQKNWQCHQSDCRNHTIILAVQKEIFKK